MLSKITPVPSQVLPWSTVVTEDFQRDWPVARPRKGEIDKAWPPSPKAEPAEVAQSSGWEMLPRGVWESYYFIWVA
jgi:hypothetical protein